MPPRLVRPNSGMDPSPLLPLGVLMVVVMTVFTPVVFHTLPIFMETAQQMIAILWVVPLVLVGALLFVSSDLLGVGYPTRTPYRRPVYRYPQTHLQSDGPNWGLLGLMLLLLLLLPWRY